MVKTKLNGKFEIIIPEHRANRPEWYTEQGWEKKRLEHMHRHLEGEFIYYIGAEEGEMPALCQMWDNDVMLIEPNPKVWSNIAAIWDYNNLAIPNCFEGFCSNKDQDVGKGFFHHEFPDSASLPVIGDHGFKELHLEADNYPQVKVDTLADMIAVGPPTTLVMDVEGSEFEVLKGAEQTLRTDKPKIYLSLHPEFIFDQWGVYSREVRDWIIKLGYKETLIDYQHEVHLYYEAV